MTDTAKPTPGPWDGAAFSDKDWVIYSTDENQKFDICHFFGDDRHVDEVEANAMLLLEAAEAFNETNLTPRQLLEQRNALLKAARSLCTELLWRGTEPNDGDTSAWDNMQDELAKHGEVV